MRKKIIQFLSLALLSLPSMAQDSAWSLNECIQYGINNNISLQQTELSNQQNRITAEQAKASRIPSVNGSASHGYSFGRSIDPFSNQFVTRNIQSNNFSLNGNVTLFNGFQITNQIKQSKINYEAGTMGVEAAKNDLTLSITQGYYQILFAGEQVENAKLQIESTESQIERTRKLVESGRIAEINLLQLQSQLASDKLVLTNAENQLYLSKVTLMQLLDLPIDQNFEIEKPTEIELQPENISQTSEEIYEEALEVQPSIKSLELRKESSIVGLKIAKGSRLPRLSLNGGIFTGYSSARTLTLVQTQIIETNIGYLQNDPTQIVSALVPTNVSSREKYPFGKQLRDNLGQSINLSLSIPIVNNRVAKSSIERAKLNMRMAELDEQNGKNILRKNVEQAYADLKSAENMYRASQEALTLLEQSYKNSERRFTLGMISPADLLIEKNNYFRAISDFSQAKYQYILKSRILEFYATTQVN